MRLEEVRGRELIRRKEELRPEAKETEQGTMNDERVEERKQRRKEGVDKEEKEN